MKQKKESTDLIQIVDAIFNIYKSFLQTFRVSNLSNKVKVVSILQNPFSNNSLPFSPLFRTLKGYRHFFDVALEIGRRLSNPI